MICLKTILASDGTLCECNFGVLVVISLPQAVVSGNLHSLADDVFILYRIASGLSNQTLLTEKSQ